MSDRPNDFHWKEGGLHPGLGSDEPEGGLPTAATSGELQEARRHLTLEQQQLLLEKAELARERAVFEEEKRERDRESKSQKRGGS